MTVFPAELGQGTIGDLAAIKARLDDPGDAAVQRQRCRRAALLNHRPVFGGQAGLLQRPGQVGHRTQQAHRSDLRPI